MDTQTTLNALFGICGALGGFVLKAMWDALTSLRRDLADLQASIADNYVRQRDYQAHADRVLAMLDKIYDKLDTKVDKA